MRDGALTISGIALENRFSDRHPAEKMFFSVGFLAMAFLLPPIPWAVAIAVLVAACTVAIARVPLRSWLTLVAAPLLFSFFTTCTLIIDSSTWSFHWRDPVFWQSVSVFARSVAAICSVAFLGCTTPVIDILCLLQRFGIARQLLDLAAMVYRFLAIALKTLGEMRLAQSWRMGHCGWRARMRAASLLTSALFVRCMERAKRLEAGLETRGFRGDLYLLPSSKPASLLAIGGVLLLQSLFLAAAFSLRVEGAWTAR